EGHRVIYMGTFSKTLFPALRIGFLVVPKPLVNLFSTGLSELYRSGQMFNQAVLYEFIQQGYFGSHIRKMRTLYSERLCTLRASIVKHFGTQENIMNDGAGLNLVLSLPDYCNDYAITEQASIEGIMSRPLSSYYINPANRRKGLLLGYSSVPTEYIDPAF